MITIVHDAALVVTAAGLVVAVVALARTRRIPLSLALLLDFFTAASLLRLSRPANLVKPRRRRSHHHHPPARQPRPAHRTAL